MFLTCPFVCSFVCLGLFVCYQTCDRDILITNVPVVMQLARVVCRAMAWNCEMYGLGDQRSHKAKMGHKNPLPRDVSRTIRAILTKPVRPICSKCPLCRNSSDAKGERSRSHETEDRFEGLVRVWLLTALGREYDSWPPWVESMILDCLWLRVWFLTALVE